MIATATSAPASRSPSPCATGTSPRCSPRALPGLAGWADRRRGIAAAHAAQGLARRATAALAPDGTRLQLYRRREDAPASPPPRRLHLLDGLALLLGGATLVLLLPPWRRCGVSPRPPPADE
jgi:hypothetical protein